MTDTDRKTAPAFQMIQSFDVKKANKIVLDNGTRLYTIDAGTQDILKIDFIFQAGAWYQPKPLIASFTNSMLSEGTKHFRSHEIAEKLDFYGAYYQPTTELDNSILSLLTLHRFLDETLKLMTDMMQYPVFPEKEFDIYRNKRRQGYKLESEKTKVLARRKFQELLFGKAHPYANFYSLEDFDQLDTKQLMNYHSGYYAPENCWIIVSGKIDDKVIQKINQAFGQNDSKNKKEIIKPTCKIRQTKSKDSVHKKDAVQSAIRIGKVTINKKHPDFLKLQIINTLLGGYFGSRLMSNIREEKGYTYGIGSALISLKEAGFFAIVTEVKSEVTEQTIDEIYKEIDRLRNELVPDAELQRVKNYILGEMIKNFDGPFALSDTYRSVLDYELDYDYFAHVYNSIVGITAEEIQTLSKQYFDPASMIEVVAGNVSK